MSCNGHTGDEEIAAYIDCGLAPAARRRVAEHLASCATCFEVYLETLHCVCSTAAVADGGSVLPFAPRRRVTALRWAAVAAAAVLALAAGLGAYRAFGARPRMDVRALVQTLGGSDGLAENVWTGEVLRGALDEEESAEIDVLSFLVGAHLVGFQATVESQNREAACAAAGRVTSVLTQAEYVATAVSEFRQAKGALCRAAAPRAWAGLVEKTSPAIEAAFLPVHLEFGEWAQAGRIAARTARNAFFERRANRRFLAWLLEQREEELDGLAVEQLRAIEKTWRARPLATQDFRQLDDAFTAILDRYEALGRSEPDFSS